MNKCYICGRGVTVENAGTTSDEFGQLIPDMSSHYHVGSPNDRGCLVALGQKIATLEKRIETIEFGIHKPFSDFTARLRAIETQLQQNTETYAEILGRIEELEKVTAWQESE